MHGTPPPRPSAPDPAQLATSPRRHRRRAAARWGDIGGAAATTGDHGLARSTGDGRTVAAVELVEVDEPALRAQIELLRRVRNRLDARMTAVISRTDPPRTCRARERRPDDPRAGEQAARRTRQELVNELHLTHSRGEAGATDRVPTRPSPGARAAFDEAGSVRATPRSWPRRSSTSPTPISGPARGRVDRAGQTMNPVEFGKLVRPPARGGGQRRIRGSATSAAPTAAAAASTSPRTGSRACSSSGPDSMGRRWPPPCTPTGGTTPPANTAPPSRPPTTPSSTWPGPRCPPPRPQPARRPPPRQHRDRTGRSRRAGAGWPDDVVGTRADRRGDSAFSTTAASQGCSATSVGSPSRRPKRSATSRSAYTAASSTATAAASPTAATRSRSGAR